MTNAYEPPPYAPRMAMRTSTTENSVRTRRWYQAHREEYLRRKHAERGTGEHQRKEHIRKWNPEKLKEFVESHGYLFLEPDNWEYSPGCIFTIAKKDFPQITRKIRLTTFQALVKS
jgi:hypothetical protein